MQSAMNSSPKKKLAGTEKQKAKAKDAAKSKLKAPKTMFIPPRSGAPNSRRAPVPAPATGPIDHDLFRTDPPRPPTELELRQARERVRARNPDYLDHMALGLEISSYLGRARDMVPTSAIFGDDGLHQYCTFYKLERQEMSCPEDVVRFEKTTAREARHARSASATNNFKRSITISSVAMDSTTIDDRGLPVVLMNDINAPGVSFTRIGGHGFAWMFTAECSELHQLGPFHLFNSPGRANEWGWRNWHYCGKYYAHRTGLYMTHGGWRRLPQASRDAAIAMHSTKPYASGETRSPEAARVLFETGMLRTELVVLQFCGLPDQMVFQDLRVAMGNSLRSAKPPGEKPNPLAKEKLFEKYGKEMMDEYVHMQSIRMTPRRLMQ